MKTQKLSLEIPEPETGFRAFRVVAGNGESGASEPGTSSAKRDSFGLSEAFWEWAKKDPEVGRELENLVQERVAKTLEAQSAKVLEESRRVGLEQGMAQGRETGKQELDRQLERVAHLASEMLAQKTALMTDHEQLWMTALGHILKRFLVPNRELALAEIDAWIKEGLANFERTGKIRLHLSDNDYRTLEGILHQLPKANWELVRDHEMSDGAVHCETNAGGVLFSSENEMSRLLQIIDRFTRVEKKA